jgi:hypothetical protein
MRLRVVANEQRRRLYLTNARIENVPDNRFITNGSGVAHLVKTGSGIFTPLPDDRWQFSYSANSPQIYFILPGERAR